MHPWSLLPSPSSLTSLTHVSFSPTLSWYHKPFVLKAFFFHDNALSLSHLFSHLLFIPRLLLLLLHLYFSLFFPHFFLTPHFTVFPLSSSLILPATRNQSAPLPPLPSPLPLSHTSFLPPLPLMFISSYIVMGSLAVINPFGDTFFSFFSSPAPESMSGIPIMKAGRDGGMCLIVEASA